jgi:multidrug efflux pump subunit AcrA (membrane-fusion protein)
MSSKVSFVRNSKVLHIAPAVVALALALAGCDSTSAQHVARVRPVLVTNAHYEAQALKRSFVGTVRPRIESDLGFRVAGKVSKRLVEVGALVETGRPLAALDEIDLKLQADQADADAGRRRGSAHQGAPPEGLVDRSPIGPGQSGSR